MTQIILGSTTRAIVNFFFTNNNSVENEVILICCWILIALYFLFLLFTIFYFETLTCIKFLQDLFTSDSPWDKSKPLWGKTFLAINKKPQNIVVNIFDEEGNFIDSQISSRGNFGFSVEPGRYYLEIESSRFSLNCIKFNGKVLKADSKIRVTDPLKEKIDLYLDNLNVNYDFQPKTITAFDNLIKSLYSSIVFLTAGTIVLLLFALLRGSKVAGYQLIVIILVLLGLTLELRRKFTLNLLFINKGKPVENALIKVKDSIGKVTYLATDKHGRSRWRFPKGKYRVEATKIGFSKAIIEHIAINHITDKKQILVEFVKDLS